MSVRAQPSCTYLVEVRLKAEFADTEGAAALQLLREQGLTALREVRTSLVYELCGPLSPHQAHQAAKDALCDPVTQEFQVLTSTTPPMNGMNCWRVEVWLKPSVSDPAADTIKQAVAEAGLPALVCARRGTAYRLYGRASAAQVEKAALKCLANPLIHTVRVSETHP